MAHAAFGSLGLNSSHFLGVLSHSLWSTGAMKMGREPCPGGCCAQFHASRSPAEHERFKPLGEGGIDTTSRVLTKCGVYDIFLEGRHDNVWLELVLGVVTVNLLPLPSCWGDAALAEAVCGAGLPAPCDAADDGAGWVCSSGNCSSGAVPNTQQESPTVTGMKGLKAGFAP